MSANSNTKYRRADRFRRPLEHRVASDLISEWKPEQRARIRAMLLADFVRWHPNPVGCIEAQLVGLIDKISSEEGEPWPDAHVPAPCTTVPRPQPLRVLPEVTARRRRCEPGCQCEPGCTCARHEGNNRGRRGPRKKL